MLTGDVAGRGDGRWTARYRALRVAQLRFDDASAGDAQFRILGTSGPLLRSQFPVIQGSIQLGEPTQCCYCATFSRVALDGDLSATPTVRVAANRSRAPARVLRPRC